MLQSMVASKAAKLMAACVCPVVGSAALTLSVPQVRDAVHKATAPREYAKPKTRVRAPAAEVAAAAVAPCPTAVPVVLSSMELPMTPDAMMRPLDLPPSNPPSIFPPPQINPPFITPIVPRPGGDPTPPVVPLLPDATTWVQMILGFGLIGGAIRVSYRRRRLAELGAPRISVAFTGIAPESERPFT